MSAAKLYRVTVTVLMPPGKRADVSVHWIAASSRKQAQARGITASRTSQYHQRQGNVHVRVENFPGGLAYIEGFTLRRETT